MIAIFITSVVLILLAACGAVWIVRNVYERIIATLAADNLDLRNRFYISKGQPPVGIDLPAKYEERQEANREAAERNRTTGRKSPAPLAKWRDTVAEKDRAQAGNGLDLTTPKHKSN